MILPGQEAEKWYRAARNRWCKQDMRMQYAAFLIEIPSITAQYTMTYLFTTP